MGHILLGLILPLCGVAAVLTPNLLTGREQAQDTATQASAARSTPGSWAPRWMAKRNLETAYAAPPACNPAACIVNVSDPENPTLALTPTNGKTIELP